MLAFSQNKQVVAIHNTSGALVFTHSDSSKTAIPKTSFGSIYASPGTYVKKSRYLKLRNNIHEYLGLPPASNYDE